MDDSRWRAFSTKCDLTGVGSFINVLNVFDLEFLFIRTIAVVGLVDVIKLTLGWDIVELDFW